MHSREKRLQWFVWQVQIRPRFCAPFFDNNQSMGEFKEFLSKTQKNMHQRNSTDRQVLWLKVSLQGCPQGFYSLRFFFSNKLWKPKFYFLHKENRVTTDSCQVKEVSHTTCTESTQRFQALRCFLHLFNACFFYFLAAIWVYSQLYVCEDKIPHSEQIFKGCEKQMVDGSLNQIKSHQDQLF